MQSRPSSLGIYATNREFEQRWEMVAEVLNWLNSSWIVDNTKEEMVDIALNVIASSKAELQYQLLLRACHLTFNAGHITKILFYGNDLARFKKDYHNVQNPVNTKDDLTRQIQAALGNDYKNRGLLSEKNNSKPAGGL